MTTVMILVLGAVMVTAAIVALLHKSLVTAILAAGAVSLVASVIYLFLAAPDVAMTEAAIGSALTTIVFLFALSRLRDRGRAGDDTDAEAPRG
jgi:energy-converting hydrogenase B subunit D